MTLLLLCGCGDKGGEKASPDKSNAGCKKDTDCKGDRVCVEGSCQAPKAKPATSTASSSAKPPATSAPKAADPAKPTFAVVAADGWTQRLGPKMWPGSKVAHKVFEGPFGPSPKSLFAVVDRKEKGYWVIVMGDDNKNWPAGPLADPDKNIPIKIPAVAFFDADGNGTTDALVMATYKAATGVGKPYNNNVLLKWTDQGLRRLLNLEPKIRELESAAAVKAALKR